MGNCHMFLVLLQFGILVVIGKPQVPCYFIFGDSLVDSGNNNNLATLAKANYLPYGIDFPKGVTGRFTNGRTMADMIGEILGFDEFIPSYASVTNDGQMIRGVNYASGGAGIRCETGSHLGDRISLDRQLCNHKTVVSRLFSLHRNTTFTNEYLGKCIYVVNIGSNDYINNYLLPTIYTTSSKYTPQQYAASLIQQYSNQLKNLYNLGGRKIVVFGLAKLGCAPAEISVFGTDGKRCVESINDVVKYFNDNLKPLVDELNHHNHDAKFTFINVSHISRLQKAVPFANIPCCEVGADWQCDHTTTTRHIRALSVYYDGFHPTEFANNIIAVTSYFALSHMDASPYDINHLVQL
uniref:GDSL esterase/lipase At1g29670-like n=1 Tax=Erigeron canadensis TaxID=72917 RepID=UPI001CB88B3F|nr:GDSL esterase/lipase At1g29670-like [Erigeron canadensis]